MRQSIPFRGAPCMTNPKACGQRTIKPQKHTVQQAPCPRVRRPARSRQCAGGRAGVRKWGLDKRFVGAHARCARVPVARYRSRAKDTMDGRRRLPRATDRNLAARPRRHVLAHGCSDGDPDQTRPEEARPDKDMPDQTRPDGSSAVFCRVPSVPHTGDSKCKGILRNPVPVHLVMSRRWVRCP